MSFPTSTFIRGYRALEPLNPETYFRSPEPRTLNPTLPEKGLCSLRMLSVSVYLGCPLEDTAASVIRKLLDQNRPSVESYLGISLVGREWKNGSHSSYNCTPFLLQCTFEVPRAFGQKAKPSSASLNLMHQTLNGEVLTPHMKRSVKYCQTFSKPHNSP